MGGIETRDDIPHMLSTGNPTERVWMSQEEKKEILKNNYGICAHCGRKLTMKTKTIEHIIPLIRGGTNDPENLCVLCEACNKKKRSMIYLPNGFYHALRGTPRYSQIAHYIEDWYHSLPEDRKADLNRFPLITPAATMTIALGGERSYKGHTKRQQGVIKQLMLRWDFVGKELQDEVEAVTGIDLRALKNRRTMDEPDNGATAAVYVLKKETTDKPLSLAAVRYHPELSGFYLYVPWCDTSKKNLSRCIFALAELLLYSLCTVGEQKIYRYAIESPMPYAFDAFVGVAEMPVCMGVSYRFCDTSAEGEKSQTVYIKRQNPLDDAMEGAASNLKGGV